MTYVAFGPLGPRTALAVSEDLRSWRRLGPLHFEYQPDLDTDLNLFPNKDAVLFPEPVPGPDGELAYAMLHRPMWDLGWILGTAADEFLPAGLPDPRPGIWISYVPVDAVERDIDALTHVRSHRLVALAEYDFEDAQDRRRPAAVAGRGGLAAHPPRRLRAPRRRLGAAAGPAATPRVRCCSTRPTPARVLARTSAPLLSPALSEERVGTVPNVVFPTAIEEIDGQRFVFYGMADSSIGVARLDRAR